MAALLDTASARGWSSGSSGSNSKTGELRNAGHRCLQKKESQSIWRFFRTGDSKNNLSPMPMKERSLITARTETLIINLQYSAIWFHMLQQSGKSSQNQARWGFTQRKPNGCAKNHKNRKDNLGSWIMTDLVWNLHQKSSKIMKTGSVHFACLALLTCPQGAQHQLPQAAAQRSLGRSPRPRCPGAQVPRCPGAQASLSKRASCA